MVYYFLIHSLARLSEQLSADTVQRLQCREIVNEEDLAAVCCRLIIWCIHPAKPHWSGGERERFGLYIYPAILTRAETLGLQLRHSLTSCDDHWPRLNLL